MIAGRRRAPVAAGWWCAAAIALAAAPAPAQARVTVYDDHARGFPGQRWAFLPAHQAYTADDGRARADGGVLRLRASGIDPATGRPAFTRTIAQEDDNAFGLPGQWDHHKLSAYTSARASSGALGFDARAGEELTFEATVSGTTYGTAGHPFGGVVDVAPGDPRLAAAAFGAADVPTGLRFEFLLTSTGLHALYARSPETWTSFDDRHAAFAFLVPLGARSADADHRLAIAYDRRAGTVRWVVDGRERLRVSRIGHRLDRRWMVLDHGGTERVVAPAQLAGTLGLRTMLDATPPGGAGPGLVRLSNRPFFSFDPAQGEPHPQLFVDNGSFDGSRLFGQGAALAIGPVLVSTQGPVCHRHLAGVPLVGGLLDGLACDLAVALGALR